MAHPAADRRLRSPASSASRCDHEHHGRFLRPGALARLRDSKIVARSLRSASTARLLPPFSPTPLSPAHAAETGVPHFFVGARGGMRYPLRKKLAAARGVVFLPPPPMSPGAADAFLGAFAAAPSELLAAH